MDKNLEKDKILPPEDTEESSPAKELEVEENKIQIISPGRMVIKRFFRSRLSVIGLAALICLFAFSFLGPIFTNLAWGWKEATPDNRMTAAEILDYEFSYMEKISSNEGTLLVLKECVAGFSPAETDEKTIQKNMSSLYEQYKGDIGSFDVTVNGKKETHYFEIVNDAGVYSIYILGENKITNEETGFEIITYVRKLTSVVRRTSNPKNLNLNASPTSDHWLGTDSSGFDVFTRLMFAGRISLTLGFVVVIIAVTLGILLGGIAGYFGKWADMIVMRVIDILNCLPGLPIMLIFSAVLEGMKVDEGMRIYFLMGMLALLGWTGTARMVRGQILMLREQEFMVAAEALGISVPRRIIKHLLPNIMPILIVGMTLSLGSTILTEASLSYLGLGIRPPKAAWGTMISSANDPIILQYYPNQWVPAGVMIIIAVLAFNFVGDGLRDAFDPKMRR